MASKNMTPAWLADPFGVGITTTEAAPPFAVFKGWGVHSCVQMSQTVDCPISNLSWCLADYDERTIPDISIS